MADAAYFTGESAPVEMRVGDPGLPSGYDYDAINADVLLHGATVKNGRITLASGANYGVLILPSNDIDMTPEMLKCLRKLVRAGAIIVGPRPQHSPSLANYPKCDVQVKKFADELWGKCDGTNVQENSVSKGRVVWGRSLTNIFTAQNLKPDFEFHGVSKATQLVYVHRVAGAADIYFVSNQRRHFDSAGCTFRVSGRVPELWHPETGIIEPAPVWSTQDGRTTVQLNFEPAESVFVIFRHPSTGVEHIVTASANMTASSMAVPMPKLEIHRAVYIAKDGAGEMDATEKLSRLISEGQLIVTASNDTLGRDPAPKHEKELRLDYMLDGKACHVVVPENETVALPTTAIIGQQPQWEVGVTNGKPIVTMWTDGQIELHAAGGKILNATATNLSAPRELTGDWNLSSRRTGAHLLQSP